MLLYIFGLISVYCSLKAMLSIYYHLLTVIGTETDGIKLILISAAYFLPMYAGVLISIKIYKEKSVKQRFLNTDNPDGDEYEN